ncbi:CopG family transcriptional regulator [Mycobacterium sp. TNTM28]|uniref:CopG family transcriptional regulator n=1 Tax=[Mycobacterium] fortunisiensis TaxID=2600579 RepID=A0ABS6KFZ1_9MYCO|nr:CopG family transcriptional regulator [[Mycobacterium] fortunisiensis]MBU9762462.1 CopG family transcriptional regulator [[Mycobacterium] fortunisiensis]
MRTTVRIDDDLYREVKTRAARSGRTVAAVLEDAVRRGLERDEPAKRPRYTVQPLGSGGLRPGIDIAFNSTVAEAMDEGAAIDALR